jgi:hypothetical protein
VEEQTEAQLLGTAEDDGTIVGYTWTQLGGPDVELLDGDRSVAVFTAPTVVEPTELVFGLTVRDDEQSTGSDDGF